MVEVVYISWSEAIDLCYRLAGSVATSKYRPDVIIAILRGGVVPALILSDVLGVEEFYAIRIKHWGIGREIYANPIIEQVPQGKLEGKDIILVDEVADTGKTLTKAIDELKIHKPSTIKTAVLHVKPSSIIQPDYYVKKLGKWLWIFYPWSLFETLISLTLKEMECETANSRDIFEYAIKIGERLGIDKSRLEMLKDVINIYIT